MEKNSASTAPVDLTVTNKSRYGVKAQTTLGHGNQFKAKILADKVCRP